MDTPRSGGAKSSSSGGRNHFSESRQTQSSIRHHSIARHLARHHSIARHLADHAGQHLSRVRTDFGLAGWEDVCVGNV